MKYKVDCGVFFASRNKDTREEIIKNSPEYTMEELLDILYNEHTGKYAEIIAIYKINENLKLIIYDDYNFDMSREEYREYLNQYI